MMEALKTELGRLVYTLDGMDFAPASYYMLAAGLTLDEYETVTSFAVRLGLIRKTSETLRLTDKGRDMAKRIEAALELREEVGNGRDTECTQG